MFNTDINHLFQQLDHPVIFWFMVLISALGTFIAVLTLVSTISYAVNFKKGLVLVNIVAWTALLTYIGKHQFDYPRPIDLDTSLNTVYFPSTSKDLTKLQPKGFLECFSPQLLEQTRNDEYQHYGFPSGHTSIQVALWISLFFLFKKRWIIFSGIAFILLTMFSRIYLGHHFLGDVVGGSILGMATALLLILLVVRTNYMNNVHQQFKSLSILWVPVFWIPFVQFIPVWLLGGLLGINAAAILIIQYKNFPVFHILPKRRVLSAIICVGLLITTLYLGKTYLVLEYKLLALIVSSLLSFLVSGGSLLLCQKLNLIRFRF